MSGLLADLRFALRSLARHPTAVIGRTIDLNGTTREIVGVMPSDFGHPNRDARLWVPSATDPLTYGAVAAALLLVSLVATWIPAARAAGIDPARALRAE